MVEIFAAVTGASLSAAIYSYANSRMARRNVEDSVLRLTMAVESVASKMEELHLDFKSQSREVFGRLNQMEQRLAKLEAKF